MNDQKPIIEIKNLTKTYRTDRKRSIVERFRRRASGSTEDFHALKNVSLTVQSGRIFVIMGLSGSGKSTLLRCVNRLLEPSEGEVTIDGKNVIGLTNKELRHLRATKLSMVFQHFALLPHMSVVDNVAFGLRIAGVPVKERRARATEILNLVGLSGWEHRRPSELSGGMRQRLGIARALVMDTPILLMDEPFSALDPLIRAELQQELLRLQRSLHKT
ncbi:ATP-binding cassette domain-containing protein, partial [Paracoccus sp. PXZ]